MSTTFDYLVTKETQSTRPICLVEKDKYNLNTSNDESILDLSQHRTTNSKDNSSNLLILNEKNWQIDSKEIITDELTDEFTLKNTSNSIEFNIERALTDQVIEEKKFESDNNICQSQIDFYCSRKKSKYKKYCFLSLFMK